MLAAGSALRRAGPVLRAGASTKASVAPPAALFVDLDDTLHPRLSGFAERVHVHGRMLSIAKENVRTASGARARGRSEQLCGPALARLPLPARHRRLGERTAQGIVDDGAGRHR
eukprot:tig00000145_g8851.t1